MKIVVIGLSLSSSWGNGHATTYRALLGALAQRGHDILFLEQDVPWYAQHRDLSDPDFCRLVFYNDIDDLADHQREIAEANAVIVGSYVQRGAKVGNFVQAVARGSTAFYDIDTPITLALLDRGDCDYLSPALIPGYDLYLSFTGGPTLARIESHYGSPAARALHCCADTRTYRPLDLPRQWDLSYLGTYSADRQPLLQRLLIEPARRLPERRFVVAGPGYPDDIQWPDNVLRINHVGPADHPAFYSRSRYTLNLTRADMAEAGWSPSVRLFEAAACATPVISDRWTGIESFFGPGEIILADDSSDVIQTLDSGGDPPAIGAAARARVLIQHSALHRAADLESHLYDARNRRHGKAVGACR